MFPAGDFLTAATFNSSKWRGDDPDDGAEVIADDVEGEATGWLSVFSGGARRTWWAGFSALFEQLGNGLNGDGQAPGGFDDITAHRR